MLLFLLPMQMRAGASDPHPHAMLHLLLDARDGLLDHHDDGAHAAEHARHQSASDAHEPDVPKTGASNVAGGAMALLAAIVVVFRVPAGRRVTAWPSPPLLLDRLPALDPPPPRLGGV